MQHLHQSIAVRPILALLIVLTAAACSSTSGPKVTAPSALPAVDTPTAAVPVTVPTATEPALPTATMEAAAASPTDTLAPSPTTAPTALVPTETPAPTTASAAPTETLASQPDAGAIGAAGLSAWCLPTDVSVAWLQQPLNPPGMARIGDMVNGALEINNLPASACVFLYTLEQPAPEGLKLEVYEIRGQKPWLTADLAPLEGRPETVTATLRHTYIAAAPLWDVSYQFAVVDASGKELRRDTVNLHRWKPPLCWNGRLPNVLTLRCPLPQDLHPWDPSYGTPIPTFPPEDD